MTQISRRPVLGLLAGFALAPKLAFAQQTPLRIEINEGVIEPVPFAVPAFVAENGAGSEYATSLAQVIADNLTGTGLLREIPQSSHIGRITSFDSPVQFSDWRTINARALVTGAVRVNAQQITVKFRLFDVVTGQQLGDGLQLDGRTDAWRRMAHRVSDQVYQRLTGESGYFDSRVVFIAESGPRTNRRKQVAIMDQDGANTQYLTDGTSLAFAPRFSPTGDRILFTSYETGFPRIYLMDVASRRRQVIGDQPGEMTFAPRFAPDGQSVVYSLSVGGSTDLYMLNLTSGQRWQLTQTQAIDTAPSFAPDGQRVIFESDRSGNSQLYIMPVAGGAAERVSQGQGRYSTPVWSPRGDLVAFTKQLNGRFHIGVMRTDGSNERLLTASFLDEGPTWSPNGRVIMFTREEAGGDPVLMTVDITGRNLRRVPTPGPASDPSWSPLLP
ncbi:Tol-Pal system beta propeller repeat protein TolB [Pararhodobacter oceanensis]|uniref:Tol-Pal system protein TolB n=1 Tax=Pararhodobacter oceanensis TaxID=2172121 RepID=A0A2T8HUA2_9RHOB|nr:Tol-Pal system beta propeller repeat protein TolB [Pararhodobacter oceanensis]PVH29040.1 Tol-Pal system protein TolB [Pararhodobacter oceanensis]